MKIRIYRAGTFNGCIVDNLEKLGLKLGGRGHDYHVIDGSLFLIAVLKYDIDYRII